MSNKQFFNNLSATYANVRRLDAKKITKNGKPIVGEVYDIRGDKATENDIWPNGVQVEANGNVTVYPLGYNKVEIGDWNDTSSVIHDAGIKSLIDNVAYDGEGNIIMFIDTKALSCDLVNESGEQKYNATFYHTQIENFSSDLSSIKNGDGMFGFCENLTTFKGDLSSLTNSQEMFNCCSQLTSFSSDLPSLTNGGYMFNGCSALTSFSSDLSSLTDGSFMFNECANLNSFNSDLSSLTEAHDMFHNCSNLTSFSQNLSKLTNGSEMFNYCVNLSEFSSDLSSLTNGERMFAGCNELTSFSSDLPSLTNGYWMFDCCYNLTSFSSDLSSLQSGSYMFWYCSNLTSFTSDLSSLVDGSMMFSNCYNLTAFNSNLSSLTNGSNMFSDCKLDAQSVANIIHFIPQRNAKPLTTFGKGNILIGIGITNTDAAKQAFAEECDCSDWAELNKEFDDKNWGVQWRFNGPASYSLRDPRPSTAVYTKLEEVIMPTEEEIEQAKKNKKHIKKPHYEYTSQDGTRFYNIHWYHESNTDNEGYDYFESLEMATLAYSVIPRD